MAPQYRLKETETSAGIIRVIVRDKVSFLAITTNNEISRRQYSAAFILPHNRLISGKGEVRTNGQPIPLPRHYAVYNPTKEVFTLDPLVVFAVGGQYLVTCRNSENIFMIYSLNSMSRLMAVAFHTVRVDIFTSIECGQRSALQRAERYPVHGRHRRRGGDLGDDPTAAQFVCTPASQGSEGGIYHG